MSKRILCIGLPDWPLQRRVVAHPEWAQQWHDPQEDQAALGQLAEWCMAFSSLVGLEVGWQENGKQAGRSERNRGRGAHRGGGDAEPACLVMDLGGWKKSPDAQEDLARTILSGVCRQGYRAQAGLADTIGAAWALAHFSKDGSTDCAMSSLAVVPLDARAEAEPADLEPVDRERDLAVKKGNRPARSAVLLEHLQRLPVEALRLEWKAIDLLRELGIFTIGQLHQLPRSSVHRRLGPEPWRRLDQALGAIEEVLVAHHAEPPLSSQRDLEYPTDRYPVIQQAFEELLAPLCQSLIQRGRGILRLQCRLDGVAESGVSWQVGVFRPVVCARYLADLILCHLDSPQHRNAWQISKENLVSRIGLEVIASGRMECRQKSWWGDATAEHQAALGNLVDRLTSRWGAESVVRAELCAEAPPEFAYRYLPLTGGRTPNARRSRRAVETPPMGSLPLHLHPQPQRLLEVTLTATGAPRSFVRPPRHYQVSHAWGPHRVETRWWSGPTIRRDYYRIEVVCGNRFWLFHNLRNGAWYLQGTFL